MRWPRFTVRRAMLGVLAIAVALGLTLPMIAVSRDAGYHVHAWLDPEGQPRVGGGKPIELGSMAPTLLQVEMRTAPFWPRYARCLLGQPWRGQPLCGLEPGRLAEACEYNNPGMVSRLPGGSFNLKWPRQILVEGRKRYPDLFPDDSSPPSPQAGP